MWVHVSATQTTRTQRTVDGRKKKSRVSVVCVAFGQLSVNLAAAASSSSNASCTLQEDTFKHVPSKPNPGPTHGPRPEHQARSSDSCPRWEQAASGQLLNRPLRTETTSAEEGSVEGLTTSRGEWRTDSWVPPEQAMPGTPVVRQQSASTVAQQLASSPRATS